MITCRRMRAADVREAFEMLSKFLTADEHYLASSAAYGDQGVKGLNDALDLFLERPELGFVWMAFDEKGAAAVCVVCYAISTSMGSVVAKLDDGSVLVEWTFKGSHYLIKEVLKEAGDAAIVEPEDIRQEIRETCEKLMALQTEQTLALK